MLKITTWRGKFFFHEIGLFLHFGKNSWNSISRNFLTSQNCTFLDFTTTMSLAKSWFACEQTLSPMTAGFSSFVSGFSEWHNQCFDTPGGSQLHFQSICPELFDNACLLLVLRSGSSTPILGYSGSESALWK